MESTSINNTPDTLITIVLGMHRSGTSVLTRGLQTLGFNLGERLSTAPSKDNEKGHWEDQDVLAINDQLLEELGLTWDRTSIPDLSILNAPTLDPLKNQAIAVARSKLVNQKTWAFKDPRTSRLLPFWLEVLTQCSQEIRLIWAIRDPQSVSESLAKRNGFASTKSNLLWLAHNLPLFHSTGDMQSVVVDYDQFLESPERELCRIEAAVGINQIDMPAIATFASNFVAPELNHASSKGDSAVRQYGARLLAQQVYEFLLSIARDQQALVNSHTITAFNAYTDEFKRYSAVCEYIDAVSIEQASEAELLIRAFEELHASKEAAWKSSITSGEAHIELSRRHIEQLESSIEQALQRVKDQKVTIEERQNLIQQLTEQHNSANHNLEEINVQFQSCMTKLDETTRLLNKERYSVGKPLLRKIYRQGTKVAQAMPAPVTSIIRRVKRKIYPGTFQLELHNGVDVASIQDETVQGLMRLALDAKGGLFDIFVFPVIDWNFRFQRPQHIAKQMAKNNHRVFYLTTTFKISGNPDFRIIESPERNVFIVQLSLPGPHPRIYEDTLTANQKRHLTNALQKMVSTLKVSNLVSIIDLPFWRTSAQSISGNFIVYDCMDFHGGFSSNSEAMLEEEDRLIKEADIVLTTSSRLAQKVGELAENTIIRNAGEIDYFKAKPDKLAFESTNPVVGYIGAISEWFDIELVAEAARHFTDWTFVLVGSTYMCDTSKVARLPNVKLIGEVPYKDASAWVHSFDVALIPFKITELTLCTNPVKAYEYLAAGKPIVSTNLPEVVLMDDMIHVAKNTNEFIGALSTAMEEAKDPELAKSRTQWAGQHDWKSRVSDLEDTLSSAFPKVSVIVLTYNNLDFTKACLQSLEEFTHYPNWELIIVDNASSDETPQFLTEYATTRSWVQVILSEENTGFSAGNNMGLQVATGDYLIVLNNDTYVTSGWMLNLIRHLIKDSGLGLVGPVTNNIGNEAKIEIQYANMEEMATSAFAYTSTHIREILDTRVVAFFCVALSRRLFDEIGGLDEAFGRGFFEDDDYCNRVREAGHRIAIAEDVFIHHHLSGSFGKLKDSTRNELFERNKAIYEKKWGPWIPHKYRT